MSRFVTAPKQENPREHFNHVSLRLHFKNTRAQNSISRVVDAPSSHSRLCWYDSGGSYFHYYLFLKIGCGQCKVLGGALKQTVKAVQSFTGIKHKVPESRIMAELPFTAFDRKLEADRTSGRKITCTKINRSTMWGNICGKCGRQLLLEAKEKHFDNSMC